MIFHRAQMSVLFAFALTLLMQFTASLALAAYVSGNEGIEFLQLNDRAKLLKKSNVCGNVYALSPDFQWAEGRENMPLYFSYGGEKIYKTRLELPSFKRIILEEVSFRTPAGRIFLSDPKASDWSRKQVKHYIGNLLADALQKRAQLRFEREMEVFEGSGWEQLKGPVKNMRDVLFKKNAKHPWRQVHFLLTIYPDMRAEILNNLSDELRPLLCPFENRMHKERVFMKFWKVFGLATLGLGISSIAVLSAGIALPAMAFAMGAAACTLGIGDIARGFAHMPYWNLVASYAAQYKLMIREIRTTMVNLAIKKEQLGSLDPAEEEVLALLVQLNKQAPEERVQMMKGIVRGKYYNAIIIVFGFLNAGFNGLNLSGDPRLLGNVLKAAIGLGF